MSTEYRRKVNQTWTSRTHVDYMLTTCRLKVVDASTRPRAISFWDKPARLAPWRMNQTKRRLMPDRRDRRCSIRGKSVPVAHSWSACPERGPSPECGPRVRAPSALRGNISAASFSCVVPRNRTSVTWRHRSVRRTESQKPSGVTKAGKQVRRLGMRHEDIPVLARVIPVPLRVHV